MHTKHLSGLFALAICGLTHAATPIPLKTFEDVREAYLKQCQRAGRHCNIQINVYTRQTPRGVVETAEIRDIRVTPSGQRLTLMTVTHPSQIAVDPDTGSTHYNGPKKDVFDVARSRSVEFPGVAVLRVADQTKLPAPRVELSRFSIPAAPTSAVQMGGLTFSLPPQSERNPALQQYLQSSQFASGVAGAVERILAGNTQRAFFSPEVTRQVNELFERQSAELNSSIQSNADAHTQLEQSIVDLKKALSQSPTAGLSTHEIDFEVLGNWISELDTVKYQNPDPLQAADYASRADQAIAESRKAEALAELDLISASQLNRLVDQHLVDANGLLTGLATGFSGGKPLLLSPRFSTFGLKARSLTNQVGASQERVGLACAAASAQNPATAQPCAEYQRIGQDVLAGIEILDRMGLQYGLDAVLPSLAGMEPIVKALRGFSEGVTEGLTEFADGMAQLALHPVDTALQVGRAFMQVYKIEDAIAASINNAYEDLTSGDPERVGHRMGLLASTLFENVLTGGGSSAALGGVKIATTALGMKVTSKVVAGGVSRQTLRRWIARAPSEITKETVRPAYQLTKSYPEVAQKLIPKLDGPISESKEILENIAQSAPKNLGGRGRISEDLLRRSERGEYPPLDELVKPGHNSNGYTPKNAAPDSVLVTSAEEFNSTHFPRYSAEGTPPAKSNSIAVEYTILKKEKFFRVHRIDNQSGVWLVREDAIRGLTPQEIQRKFSLQYTPTHVSDAHALPNARMGRSRVASNWRGSETAIQYSLLGDNALETVEFSNMRPL